jgi:hypothetical protein
LSWGVLGGLYEGILERATAQLPCLDRPPKELGVAGKKREKSLPQTDKKTTGKSKRPKKTWRGKWECPIRCVGMTETEECHVYEDRPA